MRYVGSKLRLGTKIADYVRFAANGRPSYLEPFIGGANSFTKCAPFFEESWAGDSHPDLALMWEAVRIGWRPPMNVDEETYRALRSAAPSALRGFVGFGCSFGGKWFGGYARGGENKDGPRNHSAESARAVIRDALGFGTAREVRNCSYLDWSPGSGWVVYCDPPYAGTLDYGSEFDHDQFWHTARSWAANGAIVFVSEYSAPADVPLLDQFEHRMSVALTGDRRTTTEKLFVLI